MKINTYAVNCNDAWLNTEGDDISGSYVKCKDHQEVVAALESKCAALAAENTGLKKFCKDTAFDADYEAELGMERGGFTDALNNIKTTATDAFLAEVRAQGVEMFAKEMHADISGDDAREFAAQLRKGVQS